MQLDHSIQHRVAERRLRVLVSAYACEPGKGSEPEVGWQWALAMARFHDVTVLTRANNRRNIEAGLAALPREQPRPEFVYHDRGRLLLEIKRRRKAMALYYTLWQKSAREVVAELHQARPFDLMHHVTFAGFRYPTAIWGHGAATVWGPVGGIESVPARMLPWNHFSSLKHEVLRNFNNVLQAAPFHNLVKRAKASTLVLASTAEMQRTLEHLGFPSDLMPTIGLNPAELPYSERKAGTGPLELLFVGNIITLKGVDLALEALKAAGTNSHLTFIGDGSYLAAAKHKAAQLGLSDRVNFPGRMSRGEVLKHYSAYDAFLFPSLHDTGGYAVIEAMFNSLPVICLDCGGPAVAVQQGCGVKIPLGTRKTVVAELGAAIRGYDQDRELLHEHGRAARQRVLREYSWENKAERMNQLYWKAVTTARSDSRSASAKRGYSGLGGTANALHVLLSLRGLAIGLFFLLLVGGVGFASLEHLNQQANQIVERTLPGMISAVEINAQLGQAFNRTLLLMMTEEPQQQTSLRQEISDLTAANSVALLSYERAVADPGDDVLLRDLVGLRTEYLKSREQVLNLAFAGAPKTQIVQQCEQLLMPAYLRYKKAADQLLEYNVQKGQDRGKSILRISGWTQWGVAAVMILVFVLGFSIGIFK